MTAIAYKRRKLNREKLLSFGFAATDKGYAYHTELVDGQMRLVVLIDASCKLYTEVTDKSTDEEYVLHRVPDAVGAFVGRVKAEYEAVLDEIFAKCFDPEVFKSEQAREVIDYVRDRYGNEPEYLWQRFPDNAVVRRADNQKWYAALLTVSRQKLGLDANEPVEIIDVRMRPEDIQNIVDHQKYLPGYHMNKKHWVTICLDGTVALEEIFERIDESYALARK